MKATYVGAPAIFALEQACREICDAFDGYGCYLVGSSLERADWRDVDVRFIMADEDFAVLFPKAGQYWEQDARWLLLTVAISERLSKVTGLPIDFQIQPQTHANERHKGKRNAMGLRIVKLQEELAALSVPTEAPRGKFPIDRPCSACSAGDSEMKYHEHEAPFRPATAAPVAKEIRDSEGNLKEPKK
jgi:hypothetical protein